RVVPSATTPTSPPARRCGRLRTFRPDVASNGSWRFGYGSSRPGRKTAMPASPIRRLGVVLVSLVVSGGACSSQRTAETAPTVGAPPIVPVRTSPDAIDRARADSVRHPYTDADIHFMTGMISHHAQAITMARWAPTHGASPSVQTLAGRIINAQQDEIHLMQQWLADRRLPVPEPDPRGMKMVMNGMEHTMLMPGMLTAEQMQH